MATESEKQAALYVVKRLNSLGLRSDDNPEEAAEKLINSIEGPVKVVDLDAALAYIEQKTGRKVADSSFEGDTLTAYLSGDVASVEITVTLSLDNQSKEP